MGLCIGFQSTVNGCHLWTPVKKLLFACTSETKTIWKRYVELKETTKQ